MNEEAAPAAPDASAAKPPALPHELWHSIRHDRRHLPEYLVLVAQRRLAAPAHAWAEQRDASPSAFTAELAETVRLRAAHFARYDGAISGARPLPAVG